MSFTVKAITARLPHKCDNCHWTPTLRGSATIATGHRYLRHVTFPGDEANPTGHPISLIECVACACERDPSAGLLIAGACSTFCCGDVPCARPPHRDGDHSCRRCMPGDELGGESR
jgi:hypothetical protein